MSYSPSRGQSTTDINSASYELAMPPEIESDRKRKKKMSSEYSDDFDSEEEIDDDHRSPTPDGLSPPRGVKDSARSIDSRSKYSRSPDGYSAYSASSDRHSGYSRYSRSGGRHRYDSSGDSSADSTMSKLSHLVPSSASPPPPSTKARGGAPKQSPVVARGRPPVPRKASQQFASKTKPKPARSNDWSSSKKIPATYGRQGPGESPVSLSSRIGPPTNAALRITSAKRNRFAVLKSELKLATDELEEVKRENKTLQQINRRSQIALHRYESAEAKLPMTLKRHEEEDRVFRQQVRNLKQTISALDQKLQTRDSELQQTQRKCKKMEQLVQARELKPRAQLTNEIQKVNDMLDEREVEIKRLKQQLRTAEKTQKRDYARLMKEQQARDSELRDHNDQIQYLKSVIKEREKELDVRNIYSKHIMKSMPRSSMMSLPPLCTTCEASTSTDDLPSAFVAVALSPQAQSSGLSSGGGMEITMLPPQQSSALSGSPVLTSGLPPAGLGQESPPAGQVSPSQAGNSSVHGSTTDLNSDLVSATSVTNLGPDAAVHAVSQTDLGQGAGVNEGLTATVLPATQLPHTTTFLTQTNQQTSISSLPGSNRHAGEPLLNASSSTPALHVNAPPIKFQPTKMSTGTGPAVGARAPISSGGTVTLPPVQPLKPVESPVQQVPQVTEEQLRAQREADAKKKQLLAALGGKASSPTLGRKNEPSKGQLSAGTLDAGFDSALFDSGPLAQQSDGQVLDDATKQRVKQDLKRMVMQSDTEVDMTKTPSNNDSITTLAGSEASVGAGRIRSGHASTPTWPKPVENLHSGRPSSYSEEESVLRRGSEARREFWNADKRIDSASSLLAQKGESEIDEAILRHKPPTGLEKGRRRRINNPGNLDAPGYSSEVTTTTSTTNSSVDARYPPGLPPTGKGDYHQPAEGVLAARRNTHRRQHINRPNIVPDTTDDEGYDRHPVRRPPRNLASKSPGVLRKSNLFGGAENASAGQLDKPVAVTQHSSIDVDNLPENTTNTIEPILAQGVKKPPRRTFTFTEDEDDLEEINV